MANNRELFGGAIRLNVPAKFIDVSPFRPVPDHQEILVEEETDRSVIVELASLVENFPAEEAASRHFQELANVNHATRSELGETAKVTSSDVPRLSANPEWIGTFATGKQAISKFRNEAGKENLVQISVCCIRIPKHTVDILITFNESVLINRDSSSAQAVSAEAMQQKEDGMDFFKEIVRSFEIKDFSLFC
eukprot:CAMPEP_0201489480 /NCGR_PEP_ID=MMETSP0151_2-20130828/22832_1 /ASSEMBLY_ACC=CAM_ASM_000257 /TAXON_ID=200890 /ORGANISM="Paramoeba atlantica, Strain 621/1 / CCAP 1560/9" /LENGTH=191 /DNA_ID=CAMNT_0047875091 /DNA_START=132 /DNA_END=707 /DNA_ORIENTATION=+